MLLDDLDEAGVIQDAEVAQLLELPIQLGRL
jgi:hypothetical protein